MRTAIVQESRAAFSLIELLLIVVLVGVIAMVAVPRFGPDVMNRSAVPTTAREIASDMRLARSLAVSSASTNPDGYAVRMTGSPPYAGYEIVNLMTAETVSTKTIRAGISCTGGAEFRFGPLGNLSAGSGTTLSVSGDGKQYLLTVTPATGSVRFQEQ